jgi:AAA family ATP:ADP antiporter
LRAESGEFKTVDKGYKEDSGFFGIVDPDAEQQMEDEAPRSTGGAMQLVFRSRYLLLIACLMMILNWVNTTGEFILGDTVQQAAADAVATGKAGGLSEQAFVRNFYGGFFSVVNLAALLAQLFVVSRIIKHLGVRAALLILPVISFVGYTILAFFPILAAVRWAKTAENSTDYSLQNTVRNVLFLPTTREEKYKAKQAIDAFFWRAGDLLSALLVMVGINVLMFQTRHFAIFNLVLVSIWIVLAVLIGRRYVRLVAATAE